MRLTESNLWYCREANFFLFKNYLRSLQHFVESMQNQRFLKPLSLSVSKLFQRYHQKLRDPFGGYVLYISFSFVVFFFFFFFCFFSNNLRNQVRYSSRGKIWSCFSVCLFVCCCFFVGFLVSFFVFFEENFLDDRRYLSRDYIFFSKASRSESQFFMRIHEHFKDSIHEQCQFRANRTALKKIITFLFCFVGFFFCFVCLCFLFFLFVF